MTTLVWHSFLRAEVPMRQGSEIILLNQEPGLPALSKPEFVCLTDATQLLHP